MGYQPVLPWWSLVLLGFALCLAQLNVVARHPEPDSDDPDTEYKLHYRDLTQPLPIAVLLAFSALICLALSFSSLSLFLPWTVWASAGLVLVYVDARTTWLPIGASRFTSVCLALSLAAEIIINSQLWPQMALRALTGALVTGGLFLSVWWCSRQLGFGDVRLAAMTGALTAANSWQWWFAGILSGALASAVWGVSVGLWRRRHSSPWGTAFPYGPGLWLGPWLAWGWLAISGNLTV